MSNLNTLQSGQLPDLESPALRYARDQSNRHFAEANGTSRVHAAAHEQHALPGSCIRVYGSHHQALLVLDQQCYGCDFQIRCRLLNK